MQKDMSVSIYRIFKGIFTFCNRSACWLGSSIADLKNTDDNIDSPNPSYFIQFHFCIWTHMLY